MQGSLVRCTQSDFYSYNSILSATLDHNRVLLQLLKFILKRCLFIIIIMTSETLYSIVSFTIVLSINNL